MSKRFIDTGFLDQKWIRKLLPERKSFLIYLMLKCDNGGIIDLDMEDVEFWIGKKIGNFMQWLPKNYLIPLDESDKYFMPKFIEWQYPNFPYSKVHQQEQAKSILAKYNIYNLDSQSYILPKSYIKVGEDLPKLQVNANVNANVIDNVRRGKMLFKSSGVTQDDIEKSFKQTDDLKNADAKYYYNSCKDASESKGLKYSDWVATARSWARRDIKDGKLKMDPRYRPHVI